MNNLLFLLNRFFGFGALRRYGACAFDATRLKAGATADTLEIGAETVFHRIETADDDGIIITWRPLDPFARINQDTVGIRIILTKNRIRTIRHFRVFNGRIEFKHAIEILTAQMIDPQGTARISLAQV